MKKTYQLKTNAFKGEQQVIDVAPVIGKAPVKVQAAAGARYELIDSATKAAPDNIRAMRKGKNLQIFFDGDTEPGAVIENFYQAHTDNLPTLVGRTEQGALYEYIPESAAPSAVVSQLGDTGNAYGMALGGQELAASGAAVGLLAAPLVAGFSPLLLGAGVLGAAALAGGGGGGGTGGTSGGGAAVKPNGGNALGLSIDLDKDNNGYINSTEKGTATTTSITATFDPTKVVAGQVLNFSDGVTTKTYALTAADVAAGKVTITGWALPTEGNVLTVKATLTDGANATPEASDSANLDTTSPNDSKTVGLKVNLDSNADGTINGSEKGPANTTDLTATFDKTKVMVGDKITFSDGNSSKDVTLTAADVAAGKVTSSGWALPAENGTSTYTAVLSDAAGNTTPKAEQSVKLDAVVESLKTALSIDPITGDNLLSVGEQTAAPTITVTGKVTGTYAGGDTVTLLVNNKAFTGNAGADGKFSINIPTADLGADADRQIEGSVTGGNGGQPATAAQQYAVESANTTGNVTALMIDPVTADNILNLEESKNSATTSIDLTGKVSGKFATGDTVSLLVNNKTFTGTVDADGVYKIAVLKDDLLMDGDTTVDAFVTGTGGTSAKAMQNYGVDTTIADNIKLYIDLDTGNDTKYSNDGYINKNEKANNDTTSLTAVFDKSTVSIGDVVTFTNIDTKEIKSVSLTAEMIAEGKVTSTGWTLPNEGSKLNVEAVMKDAAGNSSAVAKDSAALDTLVMNFGQLSIVKDNGDGSTNNPMTLLQGLNNTPSVIFKEPTQALEAGKYELHLGKNVIEQISSDGKLNITTSAAVSEVQGKDIYLEFWDVAGNHSTTYLTTNSDINYYKVPAGIQFMV